MLSIRTTSALVLTLALTACGSHYADRFPPPDPRAPVSVKEAKPTGQASMAIEMHVGAPFLKTQGYLEAIRARAVQRGAEDLMSGERTQRALAAFVADPSVPRALRGTVATYQQRLTLRFASEEQMRAELGRVLAAIADRNGVAQISAVSLLRRPAGRGVDLAVYRLDIAWGSFGSLRLLTKTSIVSRNRVYRAACMLLEPGCPH